jgi:hypothetical protein
MSATLQKCRPCASRSRVVLSYLFAAIVSTLVIKLLCFLHAYYALEDIARSTPSASGFVSPAVSVATAGSCKPPVASTPPCSSESVPAAKASSALDCTGRFPTTAAPFGISSASGKDTNGASDHSVAERLEGGLPQRSSSGASQAAGTPAWLRTTPSGSGTLFAGVPAATPVPKLMPGDLLKPFVVYLQVSLLGKGLTNCNICDVENAFPNTVTGSICPHYCNDTMCTGKLGKAFQ